MPTTHKVLGQAAPAANTPANLYTVPAATQTICSTLTVCNRSAAPATYRMSIRPAGATAAVQHAIIYDALIGAYETLAFTAGFTLAATDVVTVQCNSAFISFSLFGAEIT